MQARVIDNVSAKMSAVLPQLIEASGDIRIAVAFASRKGLSLIEPALVAALEAGGTAEFLVGLDMQSTEPGAVRWLLDRTRDTDRVELYCYAGLTTAGIYHPKLYLARSADQVSFIAGSSNLTDGGLRKNVEVNVLIEAAARDDVVADVYSAYTRLKFHPERVVPDDEFVQMYGEMCQREKARDQAARRDPAARRLLDSFREKARSLKRPQPTRRDLFGWLELVYDALPTGEFTNEDVYASEDDFRSSYPGNLNMRAKVRQQLQVLRDMRLIEHLATGRWRKL
jgi:HKD family nuclease